MCNYIAYYHSGDDTPWSIIEWLSTPAGRKATDGLKGRELIRVVGEWFGNHISANYGLSLKSIFDAFDGFLSVSIVGRLEDVAQFIRTDNKLEENYIRARWGEGEIGRFALEPHRLKWVQSHELIGLP